MRQRTIAKRVEVTGIGLHKGVAVKMILEPLEADLGIIFYRSDKVISIELKPENIIDTKLATVLGKDGVTISTIEHLLSALYSYGIDNIRVILDSDEMPVLDGSSIGFCMLLNEAGLKELDTFKRVLVLKKGVEVKDGDKFVKLTPSKNLEFDFKIDFKHHLIKTQHFNFKFSKRFYIEEIARARTFGFLKDVEYLRSIGLAKGGSLDNAIVLDERKVLNPDGLRFENEFVRHKILDAIGDLAVLNYPIIAKYSAFAGSHYLNNQLTLKLLSDKQNYEVVQLESNLELERVYAESWYMYSST